MSKEALQLLLGYLLLVNLAAFVLMGLDKRRASGGVRGIRVEPQLPPGVRGGG